MANLEQNFLGDKNIHSKLMSANQEHVLLPIKIEFIILDSGEKEARFSFPKQKSKA
jgi:hypothetical protein